MLESRKIQKTQACSRMKRTELLQKLNRIGAIFVRHGQKHDVYKQPRTGIETTVQDIMKLKSLQRRVL
ncbi:hypothetical protein AGMMS50293_29320 [Spirochaetia bacterium]|nr:hypothetical protein AGMMS50293_29320 [Spirochaetia bacterium]